MRPRNRTDRIAVSKPAPVPPRVWVVLALCAVMAAAILPGCRRARSYSQDTPDDVIRSAVQMVKDGEAQQLSTLVHADSGRMRAVLNRLGVLLGHMQELAAAIHRRFPQQVAEMKAEAERRALEGVDDGGGLGLLLSGGATRRSGGRSEANVRVEVRGGDVQVGGGQGGDGEAAMKRMISQAFADPYGWIDRNAPRLSTMRMADDMAAVTLDDKPVFPPVGITLREEGGKWYVALPTHLPGVSNFVPRTDSEWAIIASLIKVLDNTVQELTADVEEGRIGTIQALADKAGEKAMMPAMITFGAYAREMDVRQKRDRLTKQYRKREKQWLEACRDRAGGEAPPPGLKAALDELSPPAIEALARKDKRQDIEQMTDGQFAGMLEEWFREAGVRVSLATPLNGPEIDRVIAPWAAQRAAAGEKKGKKK